MNYSTRMVRSSAGLTQEQALLSLQNHNQFVPGTRIASIYNQGGRWVAKLIEPKTSFAGLPLVDDLTGNNIGNAVGDAANAVGDVAKGVGQNDLKAMGEGAKDYGQGVADVAGNLAQGDIAGAAGAGVNAIGQIGGDLAGAAGKNLDEVGNAIGGIFSSTHQAADIPAFDDEKIESEDKKEDKDGPELEVEFEGFDDDKDEAHEEKHEKSEDKGIKELEKKVNLILEALGISDKGEEPKAPKAPAAPVPPVPAAPAPAAGPKKSDPLPPGSGAKLKPGEVPNKPGMTPVGAPTFSSVREATSVAPGMQSTPQQSNGSAAASGPVKSAGCSCGGNDPQCPQCGGQKVGSFVASQHDPSREVSIRMAKAQLENEFKGFKVARIKRDQDYIHALISR